MNTPPQADLTHAPVGVEHTAVHADMAVEVLADPPAVGPLLARAAARSALPGGNDRHGTQQLPARRVVLCDRRVDIENLAAYARVCGFTLRDELPATYLHVVTFPTQIQLLAAPDFPLPALGMVHVANEMSLMRPVGATEPLTLTSWAQHLRPHRKGATVELVGEVSVEDEIVWRGVSTYLAKGAEVDGESEPAGVAVAERTRPPVAGDLPTWARWRCPSDLGRRYADASGDVNPIHVNTLAARAFGFQGAIAHGMWTHARALAALEGRVAPAHTVSIEFRKPILLGRSVVFRALRHRQGHDFAVTDPTGERTHMVGTVTDG